MVFAGGLFCRAQSGPITPEILQALKSARWQVRRDAFEHLTGVKDATHQPRIQVLLVRLRDTENQASENSTVDLFEDDDYLAYDAQLTPLVEEIAETTNDPTAWRAIVYGRYNGTSVYGSWIAAHQQCLPYLREQIHSKYPVRRMTAIYVIAAMLAEAKSTHPFPQRQYRMLKGTIRHIALTDIDPVAYSAAEGLGLTHDTGDAEFVERVSKRFQDPGLRRLTLQIAQQIRSANASSSVSGGG